MFLKYQVPVAHACNTGGSGGRDQKDHVFRSGKHPTQKRAGGVAQCVGSEFKPQYHKKTKQQQQKIL
jgi:hypothetical protein